MSNSSHPLIIKGTHIIIDIYEIFDNQPLKFNDTIIIILDKIVEKFNLNVVGKVIHQFEPFGVTGVYVLSESHLSIHTFVEEKKIAMDLYTCNTFDNSIEVVEYIKSLFNPCMCNYKIISR
jgi:S-adenosylmethionine decarboxylase proenzyme